MLCTAIRASILFVLILVMTSIPAEAREDRPNDEHHHHRTQRVVCNQDSGESNSEKSNAEKSNSEESKVDPPARRGFIARAIERAREGDTIQIRGACRENLLIQKSIVLLGSEGASISPEDPTLPTIEVRARDVRIEGLMLVDPGLVQISTSKQATLVIRGNTIRNGATGGVVLAGASFASLIGNTIARNGQRGILVLENSVARIGFEELNDTVAVPNTISDHPAGIVVLGYATAEINGNTFERNDSGIVASSGGRAVLAGNRFSQSGIDLVVLSNATVFLTNATDPNPLRSAPNRSDGAGIACLGGSIAGSLGPDLAGARLPAPAGALLGVPTPTGSTFCEDETIP